MENQQGKTALGLDVNTGAMLCYVGNVICILGFIYSIAVVMTDKTNKVARFHAFQSILFSVVGGVLGGIAGAIVAVAGIIDVNIGFPIFSLLAGLVLIIIGIYLFIALVLAALNAYKGKIYKITFIGNMADRWSEN